MARIRTFLAVDIGDDVRDRVVTLQERLMRSAPGVKWVEPENLHITLLFLGEVAELDVVSICRVAKKEMQSIAPFTMELLGLGAFPNTRRPKILWADVDEGREELIAMHQRLEAPLLELGCYRREERGYTPHLTLGRLNKEDNATAWGPILSRHADWEGGTTRVRELLVMSSELRRDGPVYTVMARAPLSGKTVSVDDFDEDA